MTQELGSDPTRIIYEFENTALLSNFTHLDDGSFLFIHGWYPDCQYGVPQGQLIHMQTDGSYVILSEDIMSAGDTSAFNGFLEDIRFVVSPNQHYVLWFHQGEYGLPEERTLYITDLNTNATTLLLIDGEPIHDIIRLLWVDG